MIWALVLAAGESRRMGKPKLLLPFGGSTIVETVVQNALSSKIDRVLVVLGADEQEIRERIKRLSIRTARNPRFREGMLSSVQCGIAPLPASARAVMIVLADQPDIPSGVFDSLIEAYRLKQKGITVPVYRQERGHPLLIDLKFRREIMTLDPDIGLSQLLRRHPEDILEVRVSSRAILRDIDDPEDYAGAIKKAQKKR